MFPTINDDRCYLLVEKNQNGSQDGRKKAERYEPSVGDCSWVDEPSSIRYGGYELFWDVQLGGTDPEHEVYESPRDDREEDSKVSHCCASLTPEHHT